MTDGKTRARVALAAAQDGAEKALRGFRTSLEVETKVNKNDLVTGADRATQQVVVDHLRSEYPDEPIVGEEDDGPRAIPETGPAWVVDPIDGTTNYVRGIRLWTTSVAAVVDGDPVAAASVLPAMCDAYAADREACYLNDDRVGPSEHADPETFVVGVLGWGPVQDQSAFAALTGTAIERFGDVRRFGSMQAALAFVASGHLDAAITTRRPHPWDSIAGAHLIERAGGTVTDAEGRPWRHDSESLVVSNGRAHDAVLDVARDCEP